MKTAYQYRKKVDRKLIIRQRIYFVLITILLAINIYNVAFKRISIFLSVSGFLVSFAVGIVMSRMFKIVWHEEKDKVVSRLDSLGAILLGLYILLEINKNWIFKSWFSGPVVNSFGLVVFTGLIFGRFIGTFFMIKDALENKSS